VTTSAPAPQPGPVPPDDPLRELTVARPDDPGLLHLSVVGDTYTVLLSGDDTGGRFTLIDMHVPPGGGPPPHRHDFEETFVVLDGRLDLTFRGITQVAGAWTTVNVPANAPHQFHNSSNAPARNEELSRRARPGPGRSGSERVGVVDECRGGLVEVGDQAQVAAGGRDVGGDRFDLHPLDVAVLHPGYPGLADPHRPGTSAWVMPRCLRI